MMSQILPYLRRDIIEGRLAPGERLVEPALCEKFGVSRTPLRDALRILESEGLVELIPHVGAVVTRPEAADITATFEILAVLEATAAEKAAQRRDPALIKHLKQLVESMHRSATPDRSSLWVELNDAFHRSLVLATGNARMIDIHEHLMWHVHRARHITYNNLPITPETGHQHDTLIERIEKGHSSAAFSTMRNHVLAVGADVLAASAPPRENAAPAKTARPGSRRKAAAPE